MRYVVIEPHSDDAFLSVGAHIENWIKTGNQVTIVTMVPVLPKSLANSEAYARAIGADWIGYEFSGGKNCDWSRESIREQFYFPEGQLVLPLGAAPLEQGEGNDHTGDHYRVRKWFDEEKRAWFYLDQPYAVIQKNGERINEMLRGMSVVSYLRPPARKWRHVPLFTAQAKFFYYNADKLRETTELIVRRG